MTIREIEIFKTTRKLVALLNEEEYDRTVLSPALDSLLSASFKALDGFHAVDPDTSAQLIEEERKADTEQNGFNKEADQDAWGLLCDNKDHTLEEIVKWLRSFAYSGHCGSGPHDAFGASSNSLATWVAALAETLQDSKNL